MTAGSPALAVVVKGYPRLSETFVARELEALERRGLAFSLHALRKPARDAALVDYRLAARCHYLPEYLHDEPLRVMRALRAAMHLEGFGRARAVFKSDLAQDWSRARVRRFGQACVLAAQLGPGVRHIHCHFAHSPASVTRYASLMLGIGYSISAHAKDVWTDPAWDLKAKIEGARFVVTCNSAARARLLSLGALRGVELVHHGVDPSIISGHALPMVNDGSDPSAPVRLLAVARAVEKKGLGQLLDSVALMKGRIALRVEHYGDGPLLGQLRQQVVDCGLADLVTLHGARPHRDILDAMDCADLFVFPADIGPDGDRDGIPNALLEANARGLCVVAGDAGGVRDAVEDGVSGALVLRGNAEALAGRIEELGRNPAERCRLATNALTLNARLFDGETGHDRLAGLLRHAAGVA
jgi:glycosyltransferase involved in cell wall biosynthesis